MSKLRLVKTETKQNFPYAGLFVHGVTAEAVDLVCQHLQLEVVQARAGHSLLVANPLAEGQYKTDTLTLLQAAVILAKRHSSAHCRLELVLPLQNLILRRNDLSKEEVADSLWGTTVAGGTRFVLSDASVNFLNHAGFSFPTNGSYVSLSDHHTELLFEGIKKSLAASRKEAA